jgi:hypothetical protein
VPRAAVRGKIEGIEGLTVRGWGAGWRDRRVDVAIMLRGTAVPVEFERESRPDVVSALRVKIARRYGIRLVFGPAYWQAHGAPGAPGTPGASPAGAMLDVLLDGHVMGRVPAPDRARLDAWFVATASSGEAAGEDAVLLALAIAAALGGRNAVPPAAREGLDAAALRRGLGHAVATGDRDHLVAAARATSAWLDSSPPLAWQGWACAGASGDAVESFTVVCNGERLPVSPHRQPRTDVADKLGVARVSLGFVCAVPGAIWAHATPDGACDVELQVNGRRVEGTALRVDPASLQQVIVQTMPGPDAPPLADWPGTRLALVGAAIDRLAEHAVPAAERGWLAPALRDALLAARRDIGELVRSRGVRVSEPGSLRFSLDRTDDLMFGGWACDLVANDELFEMTCDGRAIDVPAARVSRGDVQEALKSRRADLGFVMPLPVSLWTLDDTPGAPPPHERVLHLALAVNGVPVIDDFVLDARALTDALVKASRAIGPAPGVDTPMRFNRIRWLHLLSHAKAIGGVELLGDAARAAVDAARARLRISDRLDDLDDLPDLPGPPGPPGTPGPPSPQDAGDPTSAASAVLPDDDATPATPEARLARRVARLQKRLNRALDDATPAAALDQLLSDESIDPRTRDRVLLGLVPWACEAGLFDRVRAHIGTEVARHYADGGNVWQRTLLLPFLVEDGALGEAAAVLHDAAAHAGEGWINTECVAFAVRRVLGPPAPAGADPTAPGATTAGREALLQGVAALVDALRGDAWSRAADKHLRAALVTAASTSVPLGAETVAAIDRIVLRAFGLQPAFWRDLDAAVAGRPLRPALRDAREACTIACRAFDRLRALAGERDAGDSVGVGVGAFAEALAALQRLAAQGVSDAAGWIRELAQASVRLAPADAAVARAASVALAALDAADPWRVVASPWVPPAAHAMPPADRIALEHAATPWPRSPVDDAVDAQVARLRTVGGSAAAPADTAALVERLKALKPLLQPRAGAVALPWVVDLLDAAGDEEASGVAADGPRRSIETALRQAAEEGVLRACAGLAPAAPLVALLYPALGGRALAGPVRGALQRQLLDTLHPTVAARLRAPSSPDVCTATATSAPGVLLAVDAIDAREADDGGEARAADALAATGMAVVLLVPDEGAAPVAASAPPFAHRLVASPDPVQRLRDLAAWSLAHTDATLVCLVDAGSTPRRETIEALVPHRHHYTGWPARRHARVPAPGERLSGEAARVDAADRGTGYALSRWALARLLDEPALDAADAHALAALGADDRVAEVLARAGVTLTPAPRFAAPAGWLDLATPKLWPTWGPVRAESLAGSNELVLRSPRERLARIDAAPVIVVAVARNEREMLPHFLSHYRALGVEGFVMVDNGSDDGSAELLRAQPDVLLYEADTQYRQSHYGVAWQQAVLAAHGQGKWALVADLDELIVWPGCESQRLDALTARLDAQGATAAEVLMVDMYPRGGLATARLEDEDPFTAAPCFDAPPLRRWHLGSGYYSAGSTWLSGLRHRLIHDAPPNAFTSQKIALLRYAPWVRLSEGLHYASGLEVASRPLWFAHFKYHARFLEKVEQEIRRMQHYDDAAEYRQYLGMRLAATRGFFADGLSATWDARGASAFEREGHDE